MPADYAVLAPIYDKLGLSARAAEMIPHLFSFAQVTHAWMGRRVLELGTGTGGTAYWLSRRGLNVTAVDSSAEMIEIASHAFETSGMGLMWRQADARFLDNSFDNTDMVIALDLINDLNSLKDLEAVITTAFRVLEPGRMLMFDMLTVRGMAMLDQHNAEVYSDDDMTVFASRQFDYDRQTSTTRYTIFQRQRNSPYYLRSTAVHTLRGYPVQVVQALLSRTGFELLALTDMDLQPFDAASLNGERVLFVSKKPGGTEE